MYFKNLKKRKKKGNIFSADYIYAHSRSIPFLLLFSFLSLANSRAKNTHPTTRTLLIVNSVPENDFWNPSLPTRYNVPLFYMHNLHIRLAFSLSLSCTLYSCLFHSRSLLSFYQIYLYTYLFLCCTFFRQYSNAFTLCTSFLAGPWRRRAGCWPD